MQGKVAFVTGAARGQGRSHAVRLAEEGADIIAVDLCEDIATIGYPMATPEDLEETAQFVEKTGQRIVTAKADVRDAAQLQAALESGIAELGKLDIVVAHGRHRGHEGRAAAAGLVRRDQHQPDRHDQRHSGRAAAPERGRLDHRHRLHRGADGRRQERQPRHRPRRHGLPALQAALSQLRPRPGDRARAARIRANVVHPTNSNTDMLQSEPMYRSFRPDLENPTRADAEPVFDVQQAMKIPYVEPEDISNMVLFLASDEARYVTGMQLRVDAGGYLKWYDYHIVSGRDTVKVRVDSERCQGHTLCSMIAPDSFELNDIDGTRRR